MNQLFAVKVGDSNQLTPTLVQFQSNQMKRKFYSTFVPFSSDFVWMTKIPSVKELVETPVKVKENVKNDF